MPIYEQGQPVSPRCADPACATQGGYIPEGYARPRRTRGLCNTCYARHFHAGTLDRFPPKDPAEIVRVPPKHLPAHPPASAYATRLRNRRERRAEREAVIAARVALHESRPARGYSNPKAPQRATEATVKAIGAIVQAEQDAAAWLAAHPDYARRWGERPAAA